MGESGVPTNLSGKKATYLSAPNDAQAGTVGRARDIVQPGVDAPMRQSARRRAASRPGRLPAHGYADRTAYRATSRRCDMSGCVAVVGSANPDIVVEVSHHPRGGETVLSGDVRRTLRGKGANQVVAAAQAGGAETTFVGALRRDEPADLLLSSLERTGVRTDLVERVEVPTGTALITVVPRRRPRSCQTMSGHRSMFSSSTSTRPLTWRAPRPQPMRKGWRPRCSSGCPSSSRSVARATSSPSAQDAVPAAADVAGVVDRTRAEPERQSLWRET